MGCNRERDIGRIFICFFDSIGGDKFLYVFYRPWNLQELTGHYHHGLDVPFFICYAFGIYAVAL